MSSSSAPCPDLHNAPTVLAVGDVASPLRDPVHDWFAGGWLGGRVDAMDDLLALAGELDIPGPEAPS